jgi:tetratricopeptide (TPR) repeat protein
MNLLGLAAAHWQDMRVYDDERTASLMRRRGVDPRALDFEDARRMAKEARVGTVVVGDLRREGDSLAIEAKVHDVRSGDRLQTIVLRAPWAADPRPLFDALAARILGTSGAPPGERPSVLAQTTQSIEAYRAYLAGTAAMQRFQIDSAKALLQRAVGLDSNFALAYMRLRDAEGWGTNQDPARRQQYVLAAERHSASLPPRYKSLVQYYRAYQDGQLRRARGIAEDLIRRDSTDVEAWYELGEAHYHHRSLDFPHPDTLGNLGLALRSFRRALALDSTYVLAYQHITDALAGCAYSDFRVCIGDSAHYGRPEELERRFGRATLERARAEARGTQIDAARTWVAAVPGSARPRQVLVNVLYQQHRLDEALDEATSMDRLGWRGEAGMMKGVLLFMLGRPDAAAMAIDSGLAAATDTLGPFAFGLQSWTAPAALLAAAGHWSTSRRLNTRLFQLFPLDTANGPSGARMAKEDLGQLADWYMAAEAGVKTLGAPRGAAAAELRTIVDRYARGDTVVQRRYTQALGSALVGVFLVTRDTTLLADLLRHVDTLNSATWRVADAQLALARGDTARARTRVERHYKTPAESEFTGEQGIVRSFAWADLLTRLHQPEAALAAYARVDTMEDRLYHPGFVVRSWAERGALHQQLGHKAEAIADYQRFIEAWRHADPEFQPLVDRARAAVAALQGMPRREPGDTP